MGNELLAHLITLDADLIWTSATYASPRVKALADCSSNKPDTNPYQIPPVVLSPALFLWEKPGPEEVGCYRVGLAHLLARPCLSAKRASSSIGVSCTQKDSSQIMKWQ